MGTKHTPGPWFEDGRTRFAWYDEQGRHEAGAVAVFAEAGVACVAMCLPGCLSDVGRDDAAKANARLIAAAPDLLRVAQLLVDWLDEEEGAHALCDTARVAIAKATGAV